MTAAIKEADSIIILYLFYCLLNEDMTDQVDFQSSSRLFCALMLVIRCYFKVCLSLWPDGQSGSSNKSSSGHITSNDTDPLIKKCY